MKHLILARTDAIGDLILTIPVARAIKARHPELTLTMLASRYAVPLLRKEPYLDQIVTLPGRDLENLARVGAFARDLQRLGADAILFFYPRPRLALAAWRAGIRERIGTGRRAYSLLFNRRVKLSRRQSGFHELELNYRLAEAIFPGLERFEPELVLDAEAVTSAMSLLEQLGLGDKGYVIIHPLSHGSAPNWSVERYLELTKRLAAAGSECVITGTELERETLEVAFRPLGERVHVIAGRTELAALVALIRMARLVVAGSTGPIHIAAAVGTFAVGIYPPVAALSAVRWGPRGGANKLFVPPVDEVRGGGRAAMERISVEEVAAFITERLRADNSCK